jgi:hypothetical protein
MTSHALKFPNLHMHNWLSQHLTDNPFFMRGRPSLPPKHVLHVKRKTSLHSTAVLSSLNASEIPAVRMLSLQDVLSGSHPSPPLLFLPAPPFLPETLDMGLFCEQGARLRNEDMAFAMRLAAHADAVDTFSQAVCCGLFDGHGGVEVAEHLAEFLPEALALRSHTIKSQGVKEVSFIQCSTVVVSNVDNPY